jgi:hypothetical protein
MTHPPINIRGQRFGLLTAVKVIERTSNGWLWRCRCRCSDGKSRGRSTRYVDVLYSHLKLGVIRHCGCADGRHVKRKKRESGQTTFSEKRLAPGLVASIYYAKRNG